jgi:hypothetical protein
VVAPEPRPPHSAPRLERLGTRPQLVDEQALELRPAAPVADAPQAPAEDRRGDVGCAFGFVVLLGGSRA